MHIYIHIHIFTSSTVHPAFLTRPGTMQTTTRPPSQTSERRCISCGASSDNLLWCQPSDRCVEGVSHPAVPHVGRIPTPPTQPPQAPPRRHPICPNRMLCVRICALGAARMSGVRFRMTFQYGLRNQFNTEVSRNMGTPACVLSCGE